MSASPDFMTALMEALNGGQGGTGGILNSPLFQTGLGIMSASGPNRMPVGLGQALAGGAQQGMEMQNQSLQQAMQRLMLGRTKAQLALMQDAMSDPSQQGQPQGQVTPNAASMPATGPMAGAQNPPAAATQTLPGIPQGPNLNTPMPAINTPGATSSVMTQPPPVSLPGKMDPYQDPIYLRNQKLAQVMDMMQPGTGAGYAAAAAQRIDYLQKLENTLTPEQAKLLIPGGTVPGQSVQYAPATGKFETVGTEALKPTSVFSPSLGTMVPVIQDVRSGKIVSGNVPSLAPDKPLPGVMESKAQSIANYDAPPVTENRGDPGADAVMARVRNIAQANGDTYDATQYANKAAAVKKWGSGPQSLTTQSANKAVLHIDTLEGLISNMNNTQSPAFNHFANLWKQQTGQSPPTSFELAHQIAMDEVTKFITGGGGVADRDKMQGALGKASSPSQLLDGLNTVKELMGGQLYAAQKSYEGATGLHDFAKRYLFPQTQELLKTIQNPEGEQQPTGGLPAGWKVVQH